MSRILIPTEAVTINQIKPLDTGYSVKYTGINSNLQKSKIITLAEFEQLDILTAAGSFNFGIIGFMSQNTEGVSDLGNLQNFLSLLPQKHHFLLKNWFAT